MFELKFKNLFGKNNTPERNFRLEDDHGRQEESGGFGNKKNYPSDWNIRHRDADAKLTVIPLDGVADPTFDWFIELDSANDYVFNSVGDILIRNIEMEEVTSTIRLKGWNTNWELKIGTKMLGGVQQTTNVTIGTED